MKVLVFLLLAIGLIFAVSRVTDLRTVLNLPKAAERRLSTWDLVYGGKSPANINKISTADLISGGSKNYKSPVTSKGNYADFKVVGGSVKDFTDRFNISSCNLTNYVVKGPATVSLTNDSFSFNQNGFIVSGNLDSVTSRLENYPAPECGAGAKINAGPFTYKVSLQ